MNQRGIGRLRWSPDGRRIAFHRYVGDQTDIFLVDVIGGNVVQLTDHPLSDINPTWSADGEWIYFSSTRSNETEPPSGPHIWKISTKGGPALLVTEKNGSDSSESLDGKRLLFTSDIGLFEKSLLTGVERRLDEPAGIPIIQNRIVAGNGIYILYQGKTGQNCLALYNPDSSQNQRLTCLNSVHYQSFDIGNINGFSLSPSGRQVALSLNYSQGGEISMVPSWR